MDGVSCDGSHVVTAIWKYDRRAANGAGFVCFGQVGSGGRLLCLWRVLLRAARLVRMPPPPPPPPPLSFYVASCLPPPPSLSLSLSFSFLLKNWLVLSVGKSLLGPDAPEAATLRAYAARVLDALDLRVGASHLVVWGVMGGWGE